MTFSHANTLQKAKYKLKTAVGISEKSYSHSEESPIYGSGQGATNLSNIWLLISSELAKIYDTKANGATLISPNKQLWVIMMILGFVDDVTNQVNDFLDNSVTVETLVEKMTHDCQLWSNLLRISGGLLELEKCSYHFIQFEFHPDGTPFMSSNIKGPPIRIITKKTMKQSLKNRNQYLNFIKYWDTLKPLQDNIIHK